MSRLTQTMASSSSSKSSNLPHSWIYCQTRKRITIWIRSQILRQLRHFAPQKCLDVIISHPANIILWHAGLIKLLKMVLDPSSPPLCLYSTPAPHLWFVLTSFRHRRSVLQRVVQCCCVLQCISTSFRHAVPPCLQHTADERWGAGVETFTKFWSLSKSNSGLYECIYIQFLVWDGPDF